MSMTSPKRPIVIVVTGDATVKSKDPKVKIVKGK